MAAAIGMAMGGIMGSRIRDLQRLVVAEIRPRLVGPPGRRPVVHGVHDFHIANFRVQIHDNIRFRQTHINAPC